MMEEERVHRLFIIKSAINKNPAALITMTDVLEFLLRTAQGPLFSIEGDAKEAPRTTPRVLEEIRSRDDVAKTGTVSMKHLPQIQMTDTSTSSASTTSASTPTAAPTVVTATPSPSPQTVASDTAKRF